MPFVWRDAPENADLVWVTREFAEALAAGDWEDAASWANLATDVAHGAYVMVRRDDGECQAMTRQAQYCPHPPRPGERVCGLHARYIKAHKADA
jgi:hypothetical protein